MRAFIIAVVIGVSCSVAGIALADGNTHRKATEELMVVMKMESLMKESIAKLIEVQSQANPALAPYHKVMTDFFEKYIGWKAVKDDYVKLYMKAFTEAEIKDLLTFYKSKTGKKAASKVPELMTSGAEIGQARVQQHMGELMQLLQAAQTKPAK